MDMVEQTWNRLHKWVFEQRLAYNRKSGFETAFLSLPLRVFSLPEAQNALLVDNGGAKLENRLHKWVFESAEAISGLSPTVKQFKNS